MEVVHDKLVKSNSYYNDSKLQKTASLMPSTSRNLITPTLDIEEFDLSLKKSLYEHNKKYQDFLRLMDKYNNERLRIIKEEAKTPVQKFQVIQVKEEMGLFETIKSIFRKKKLREDIQDVKEEEIVELKEKEPEEEDQELKKFNDLVQKHDDSYNKFQKLINQSSVEENSQEVNSNPPNNQLLGLRKKHLQMSNVVKKDLKTSFADITVYELTSNKKNINIIS
jgi:hypothetical protein